MAVRSAPIRLPSRGPARAGALLLGAAAIGALVPGKPAFAIALALAAVLAAVVAVDPRRLPVFLVFTMFVESLSLGPGIQIGRVAGLLALGVVALWLLDRGLGGLRPNALLAVAAAYGLWTILSAYWASAPSLVYRQGLSYLLAVAYMVTFAVLVRRRRELTAILATLAVGSLVFGLVSFVEYAASSGTARAAGLQGDPNYFATYQVVALPAALVLAALARRAEQRLGYYAVVGVIVLSVVSSLSRTGLIALVAAVLATLLLPARVFFRRPSQKLSYALAIAAAGGVAALAGSASFVARAQTILNPSTTGGGSGRTDLWAAALHGWHTSPWFGLGAGNFQARALDLLQTTPGVNTRASYVYAGRVVHNTYLETLTELGVVGLGIFALLLGLTALYLVRSFRRARAGGDLLLERVSLALLVSLLGFCLSAFFLSNELGRPLWIIVGLALALDVLGRRAAPAAAPAGAYDPGVRSPDEPDDEVARKLETLLRDQERIDRRRHALDERERELAAREQAPGGAPAPEQRSLEARLRAAESVLAASQRALAARERDLAEAAAERARLLERADAVTAREQELAELRAELEQERESLAAERERALPPPPEPEPEPAAAPPPRPAGSVRIPRLDELERLAAAAAVGYPERAEEWQAYLFFLRDHADAEGVLPESFEALVDEVFGDVLR